MKAPGRQRGKGMLPVMTLAPWHDAVERALVRYEKRPAALIQILHAIQDELRHVPPDAVPVIANVLNLSRAEVHGVVTFYHDFKSTPLGRHVVRICRAESCQAVGSEMLAARARAQLRVGDHGTTPDGAVTFEPVYCLGNCALSPAMTIDGEIYGRVTAERLEHLLGALSRTAPSHS